MARSFDVVYAKLTSKKRKWDGLLKVNTNSRRAVLYNEDGQEIDGADAVNLAKLEDGEQMVGIARHLDELLEQHDKAAAAKAAYDGGDGDQQKLLKTAGAYKKRARAAQDDERYDHAAADLIRALLRAGLDPQAGEKEERARANQKDATFRRYGV